MKYNKKGHEYAYVMFNSALPRPIKRTIEISYRHESFSCCSQQKSIPNKNKKKIDNKRGTQHIIFLELMTK